MDELRRTLAIANECRRRVTFRAGGHSFDSQSLGEDLVISLERLTTIEVLPEVDGGVRRIRVGAGATWGAIVRVLEPFGLVPAVMVTSTHATAGGTLSGDCLSRFSSVYGREGKWVDSFTLLTIDGRTLHCRPNSSDELERQAFRGAIGGLGYLGAVTEITYRVLRVRDPRDPREPLGVKSSMSKHENYDDVAAALAEPAARTFTSVNPGSVALNPPKEATEAPWATILRRELPLRRLRRLIRNKRAAKWALKPLVDWAEAPQQAALVFRSSYAHTAERKRMPQDRWPLSWFRWWLVRSPVLTRWSWWLASATLPRCGTYYEDVEKFTFMMDGHTRAKQLGNRMGQPMKTVQQTFVVPLEPQREGTEARAVWVEEQRPLLEEHIKDRLKDWLHQAGQLFADFRLEPTLQDIEFINDTEDFWLSANAGMRGFAVSYAFETSNRAKIARVEAAFIALSKKLHDHPFHGRVYLVKNVYADQTTLGGMYATNAPRFFKLKCELDPRGLIRNDFLMRNFGELYREHCPGAFAAQTDAAS